MAISSSHKLFYLNSRSRLSGTDSNFIHKVEFPKNSDFDRICVLDISIPKSYYLVQSGTNTFTLEEDGKQATITITPANYNIRNLLVEIATRLNGASPNGWTYAVTYPSSDQPDTGKFTYSVSGNGVIQPSFIFTENLHYVLGFFPNTTNTFVADTLTSTHVVNLQRETTMYLHSNICSNDTDDILQEVFCNGNPDYSAITYSNTSPELTSKALTHTTSNTYYFRLTNEDNEEVHLNGHPMIITICAYKENAIYDLIRKVSKVFILDRKRNLEIEEKTQELLNENE